MGTSIVFCNFSESLKVVQNKKLKKKEIKDHANISMEQETRMGVSILPPRFENGMVPDRYTHPISK